VLRDLHVPATFFVIGDQVMRAPELVVREAQEGTSSENHSFNHPHLESLTPRGSSAELFRDAASGEASRGPDAALQSSVHRHIDPDQPDDLAVLRIALPTDTSSSAQRRSGQLDPKGNADRIVQRVMAASLRTRQPSSSCTTEAATARRPSRR